MLTGLGTYVMHDLRACWVSSYITLLQTWKDKRTDTGAFQVRAYSVQSAKLSYKPAHLLHHHRCRLAGLTVHISRRRLWLYVIRVFAI